ncbi:hypothetical protein K438DRAFT_1956450 [Mycena galopus ATCC 62051]|nr:hypothetical protein K438DRAFT_1956450 [Mycena galopus ATCC 62051]
MSPHNISAVSVTNGGVASLGPESDDADAYPGFRVQVLARQVAPSPTVERLSNVRCPEKTVGLFDQPKRLRSNMACLSALLSIGSSMAYMLCDTGSNTDSITPEYAHVIGSPRIKLDEQVVLQLGCVGSRSKISYGTRAPINFGGIKGFLYLGQVNLDRYDGIIGTPFMNRHGVILDFARREIQFPNGNTIPALPTLEEASILAQRRDRPRAASPEIADEYEDNPAPTLPLDHPSTHEAESNFANIALCPVPEEDPPQQSVDGYFELDNPNDPESLQEEDEVDPSPPIHIFTRGITSRRIFLGLERMMNTSYVKKRSKMLSN